MRFDALRFLAAVALTCSAMNAETIVVTGAKPLSGPTTGGTLVTLTGSGFHDDQCRITCASDRITVDGVPATFVRFPSPGVITFTTPPHPEGAGEIEIVTPSGDVVRTNQRFTYVESAPLLLRADRFDIRLSAVNPRNGSVARGVPMPFNDKFGFFVLPAFTADTENPEVFVKMVGPLTQNGEYLFFYGGLTDVEYTVTVTDTVAHKTYSYFKPAGEFRGDALQP